MSSEKHLPPSVNDDEKDEFEIDEEEKSEVEEELEKAELEEQEDIT